MNEAGDSVVSQLVSVTLGKLLSPNLFLERMVGKPGELTDWSDVSSLAFGTCALVPALASDCEDPLLMGRGTPWSSPGLMEVPGILEKEAGIS